MNINTSEIYNSLDDALAAGEDEKNLVSATNRETLEQLRKRLDLNSKYKPHQNKREMNRRIKQMQK